MVDINFMGNDTRVEAAHSEVVITDTGMFYLWFVICDKNLGGVSVSGSTVWKNPAGYLPGMMAPLLPFYGLVSLVSPPTPQSPALFPYDDLCPKKKRQKGSLPPQFCVFPKKKTAFSDALSDALSSSRPTWLWACCGSSSTSVSGATSSSCRTPSRSWCF